MKQSFETWSFPQYVCQWFGCRPKDLQLLQMRRGEWLLSGGVNAIIICARTAPEARAAVRDFISKAAPKMDRRRNHWVYT